MNKLHIIWCIILILCSDYISHIISDSNRVCKNTLYTYKNYVNNRTLTQYQSIILN